jgi:hypothetical protein
MTLTFSANGSTATTASEATLSEITSDDDAYWGAMVYVPSTFTTGDSVIMKFYIYDINATTITGKIVYARTITDSQAAEPGFYFPPVAGKRYRLTIQRLLGTDRTFTWYIIKQTG